MKISTKGRYAVRMLLDLAQNQSKGFVTLKDISERQGLSKKYLEQIIPLLNNEKLLTASRGFQGGYKLSHPPAFYTIGKILRITEGSLAPVACLDNTPIGCERVAACPTLYIWQGLQKAVDEYLDSITLQDVLDHSREKFGYDFTI